MAKQDEPPLYLDPISEWRAWQALSVYFAVLLNRQIRRRWLLEHQCMHDRPVSQRFRPVLFLEPVPTLVKPRVASTSNANINTDTNNSNMNTNAKNNPYNPEALTILKQKVRLLRARTEKGKELASEIERRMQDPRILYPTHFCHTCVQGDSVVEVLLTKCGHRVCRTCLSFAAMDPVSGLSECSICFVPVQFVARSPLAALRSCSEQISNVSSSLSSRVSSNLSVNLSSGSSVSKRVLDPVGRKAAATVRWAPLV